MPCSPQRYLANDRNLLRSATLTPSSVQPVEDQVLSIPLARRGTAEARLAGAYEGAEEATYDVEITDTAADTPVISAPVATGAGSSRLVDIAATGLDAQSITVELVDAGSPATYAAVSFEGVTLKARAAGDEGNQLRIAIDQSGLTFSDTDFALLEDLRAGQGGPSAGLAGSGWDWETAVLGADNVIPATAKRVAFGDDRSQIYLAYKRYSSNEWRYHFVPEIKRDIPKGTKVRFVTGGREVTVSDGGSPDEAYPGIVTVYDILIAIRNGSQLLMIDGIVANDRSPTGQASRELLVRTDAHVQPSYGSGSQAATGFEAAFANPNARTELVIARCYATTGRDHPLARLGAERWEVSSSIGGVIGEAVTGVAFVDPDASRFGFTIPRKLPTAYGIKRGRFEQAADSPQYMPREGNAEPPPICPVSLTLGTEAVDQVIELVWTKRPSGDCDCSQLPKPRLGGECLGIFSTEDDDMSYSAANRERLRLLHKWLADSIRANSAMIEPAGGQREGKQDPAYSQPVQSVDALASLGYEALSLRQVVERFHSVIDELETLTEGDSPDLRAEGETAWDAAVEEFQSDIDEINASGGTPGWILNAALTDRYLMRMNEVLMTAGISPLGKSDASIVESGDGCWRDWGDTHYWAVSGSARGGYAPAFCNHPYYSCARASEEGKYFSTKEFAFQINVKPECVSQLIEGDKVILIIGDTGYAATYQNGDQLILPVVAAQDLYLAGGRDDDSTQTWSVYGSVDGPFPPWEFIPNGSPTSYDDLGLSFDIEAGGIPNEKGDRFTFDITGGNFRWRKNGGAWSSPADIPVGSVALDAGLSLAFVPGASPAFYTGDLYSFRALQPWAVSNVSTPLDARWQWAEESPDVQTLDIDLGSVQDLDTIALWHTIPSGATLLLSGGDLAIGEWTEPITWREFLTVQPTSQARSARYLRLTITDGADGGIKWLWIGEALATTHQADVQRLLSFRVARSEGPLSQGGSTLGKARGATVDWDWLNADDAAALDAMVAWAKDNDDEPIIVLPHTSRPGDAILGHVVEDEIVFVEESGENRNDSDDRWYSARLSLNGVWQ